MLHLILQVQIYWLMVDGLPGKNKSKSKISPCVICSKKKFRKFAERNGFVAQKCRDCGMISINPRPNEKELSHVYQGYNKKRKGESELLIKRKKVYKIDKDWISKFIDKGKVLDVGCSEGQFLSHFDSKKWLRYGIEVEKEPADNALKKFGIPVKVGNIVDTSFKKKFDLVILRGVIEHFSEPIDVLKKCSQLLKTGGYLFITATPAGDSFAFDVYKEKWSQFVPPYHLHFFSVNLLSRVLKKFGMRLTDYHYQYEETPYGNREKDYKKIKNDIMLSYLGKKNNISISPPFPGTMMTAVWKKI